MFPNPLPNALLKDVTQTEIIDFIEEHIVHRFGIPQTLTTNQRTMFIGRRVLVS